MIRCKNEINEVLRSTYNSIEKIGLLQELAKNGGFQTINENFLSNPAGRRSKERLNQDERKMPGQLAQNAGDKRPLKNSRTCHDNDDGD